MSDQLQGSPNDYDCPFCGDSSTRLLTKDGVWYCECCKSKFTVGTVELGGEQPAQVPVVLDLSPAAEGPAWEWPAEPPVTDPLLLEGLRLSIGSDERAMRPAEPVTVINDQGGATAKIPTVSCRRCQAEIHQLAAGDGDEPWADWAGHVLCSGISEPHEPEWSTAQMQRDFEVRGYSMGLVVAVRRSDSKLGSLCFGGQPRRYYGWAEDK